MHSQQQREHPRKEFYVNVTTNNVISIPPNINGDIIFLFRQQTNIIAPTLRGYIVNAENVTCILSDNSVVSGTSYDTIVQIICNSAYTVSIVHDKGKCELYGTEIYQRGEYAIITSYVNIPEAARRDIELTRTIIDFQSNKLIMPPPVSSTVQLSDINSHNK
jgi:hypothetical protein